MARSWTKDCWELLETTNIILKRAFAVGASCDLGVVCTWVSVLLVWVSWAPYTQDA